MAEYSYKAQGENEIRIDVINDRNNLAWAIFDRSGNAVKFCSESFMMHWNHADDAMISSKIKSFSDAPFNLPVYIRFNKLPKGNKSRNFATGTFENGLSVYSARYDLISCEYKICGSGFAGALITYTIKRAPIYFVTGEEVGKGSDGEPLLKNVKVLSEACVTDKGGYILK